MTLFGQTSKGSHLTWGKTPTPSGAQQPPRTWRLSHLCHPSSLSLSVCSAATLPLPQAGHVLASDPWHLLSSGALFFQVPPGHSLSSSKSVQVTFPDTLFNVAASHPHYPLLPGLFSFQF